MEIVDISNRLKKCDDLLAELPTQALTTKISYVQVLTKYSDLFDYI